MKAKDLLTIIIIFLLVNYVFSMFSGNKNTENQPKSSEIVIAATSKEYGQDDIISIKISNNTNQVATLKNTCPNEPLQVLYSNNGKWETKTNNAGISCEGTSDLVINPGQEHTINFKSWNHALFSTLGKYKVRADLMLANATTPNSTQSTTQDQLTQIESSQTQLTQASSTQESINIANPTTKTIESAEFEVKPQSWLGFLWTTVCYQPIYNVLILLTSILPFHDLGFAILLLTILIRTILLIPSQKALVSQRRMNELQPKLNKIKEKYKDNQEMIAKETMALWKEYKVNPFGSCLPLLIQFPILIALFYVIQDGLNPNTAYLLYEPLKNFDVHSINVIFLGFLDLTKVNAIALPLFVGGLQFLQMKLSFVKNKKKDEVKPEKNKPGSEMEMASKSMIYFMPVMIALFTASVPAGVGLYWSISTLYGIIQQLVVNKQVDTENNVKVRVLPPRKETDNNTEK